MPNGPQNAPKAATDAEAARQFNELVLPHLDVVYRVALKLSGRTAEADDLVQETFLRAFRSFQSFELRAYGAKPWLLKILHNAYFTRRGQEQRSPSLMDDIGVDDVAAGDLVEPIGPLGIGELNWEGFDEELKHAVERLAPEYRSVLTLWALGDLSYKEIADVLGVALGTVMSRLYRARKQLTETLKEYAESRGIRPTTNL
ncbi:MAG: sigma-70 family RNA polymerase sigma factor [Planctomycetes bacterium]|nr:sigma-70 family RNA polymerase sigma factor [Planctomycetota bacterium]